MRPQDFRQWRVVELRPGVFGVERRRRLFLDFLGFKIVEALGWGWHDWFYDPDQLEFRSQLSAENFITNEKQVYADKFYRKFGVPGYPRPVK